MEKIYPALRYMNTNILKVKSSCIHILKKLAQSKNICPRIYINSTEVSLQNKTNNNVSIIICQTPRKSPGET